MAMALVAWLYIAQAGESGWNICKLGTKFDMEET